MKVKKKSQQQERSVAKDLNARTVVASGALWGSKGDVRHNNLLVECKTTDKSFYPLTIATWEKIEKEAINDGLRIPVMCIDVNGGKDRYAVFTSNYFNHYRSFADVTQYCYTKRTDKKSFRVSEPVNISMTAMKSKTGETPSFIVIPWADFLYMLKNGE